jgi:hypothetical protein
MTQTTPHGSKAHRGVRLGDLELDEDRWRKLFELATDDRRDPRDYALIVLETHVDRQWLRRTRRKASVA